MEHFVVSARKYRPATFDTVVGQSYITTTLQNAIKHNHLAQAFLFCGPRGVGKTTCARILAKTINCENITADIEPCNTCESCVSFNDSHSLNIYELDAASNNSVEDIRSLTEQVRFAPHQGKFKIYIIDEVHMLSTSAFNAFLKTLEEPPPYAIFILATTEKHKIIPTILSRCQIYDFSRISIKDIAEHLERIAVKEGVKAESAGLHLIAQKADGALRDALSIFDQIVSFSGNDISYLNVIENLNILDYDYYFRIISEVVSGNIHSSLLIYNEIINKGFDGHNFISGLSGHLRNLMMCQQPETVALIELGAATKEKYLKQAGSLSPSAILVLLEMANHCDLNYKASKNQRLFVELTLMKMCNHFGGAKNDFGNVVQKKSEFVSSPEPIKTNAPTTQIISPAKIVEEQKAVYTSEKSEQKTEVVAKPVIAKTFSLNSSEKKIQQVSVAESPVVISTAAVPFDSVQLITVWKKYAAKLEHDGKRTLLAALNSRVPVLKENFLIEFEVDSLTTFLSEKSELVNFLRKELNNFSIELNILQATLTKEKDVPYTNAEKFKKMAEKNPNLNNLKDLFDLDIGL